MSACPRVVASSEVPSCPKTPLDRTSRGCTDRNTPQSHICKIYCRAMWLIKIQIYKTFGIYHKNMDDTCCGQQVSSHNKQNIGTSSESFEASFVFQEMAFSKSPIVSLASVNILNASFRLIGAGTKQASISKNKTITDGGVAPPTLIH